MKRVIFFYIIIITFVALCIAYCEDYICKTEPKYVVKNVEGNTSLNWGILSQDAKVCLRITINTNRKVRGFIASYPNKEIAGYLRDKILKQKRPNEGIKGEDTISPEDMSDISTKQGTKEKKDPSINIMMQSNEIGLAKITSQSPGFLYGYKKCLIKLIPKFDDRSINTRDQEVIAKLSIPITYTHYVDFIIDIEGNQYRVAPPFDTRTEIISIPEEEDMVVDFGKNIQEEQGNGTVF